MLVTLIGLQLNLQILGSLVEGLAAPGLGLEDQKVVLHIVVDAAHPLLVPEAVFVVGLLLLQSLGPVPVLEGVADVGRHIDAAKAGEDRGKAHRVDDGHLLRHEVDDDEDTHKGGQHHRVHHPPHGGGEALGDPLELPAEEAPGPHPEPQPGQQGQGVDQGAPEPVGLGPAWAGLAGGAGIGEEKVRPGVLHEVVDRNEGGVEHQHRRHLLHPPPPVEDSHIAKEAHHGSQQPWQVVGIDHHHRQLGADHHRRQPKGFRTGKKVWRIQKNSSA